MAAYLIVEIDIKDPQQYETYRRLVPPTIAQYGGKYVVRGGDCETIEGDWKPKRVVIVEFESMERAKQWWSSPEYREARDLRHSIANTRMVLAPGV
jgi:uncharacterized protein (DUF1330 family)